MYSITNNMAQNSYIYGNQIWTHNHKNNKVDVYVEGKNRDIFFHSEIEIQNKDAGATDSIFTVLDASDVKIIDVKQDSSTEFAAGNLTITKNQTVTSDAYAVGTGAKPGFTSITNPNGNLHFSTANATTTGDIVIDLASAGGNDGKFCLQSDRVEALMTADGAGSVYFPQGIRINNDDHAFSAQGCIIDHLALGISGTRIQNIANRFELEQKDQFDMQFSIQDDTPGSLEWRFDNGTGSTYPMILDTLGNITLNKTAVTQITSATTAVVCNSHNGVVTTVSSSLAAEASSQFEVTCSLVKTGSLIQVSIQDYTGTGIPVVRATEIVNDTSFDIVITNAHSSAALNGVLKISYIIV